MKLLPTSKHIQLVGVVVSCSSTQLTHQLLIFFSLQIQLKTIVVSLPNDDCQIRVVNSYSISHLAMSVFYPLESHKIFTVLPLSISCQIHNLRNQNLGSNVSIVWNRGTDLQSYHMRLLTLAYPNMIRKVSKELNNLIIFIYNSI